MLHGAGNESATRALHHVSAPEWLPGALCRHQEDLLETAVGVLLPHEKRHPVLAR